MPETSLTIDQVLTLLAETPQHIAALTASVKPAELQTPSAGDEWSVNDVLAHLRSCADVWGDCISKILSQDKPTLRHISPRTWIRKTNYLEQQFQPSLRAFTAQRAELLALLEPLPRKSWSRSAIVKKPNKTIERTVLSYAQGLVNHEHAHIEQIAHLMRLKKIE